MEEALLMTEEVREEQCLGRIDSDGWSLRRAVGLEVEEGRQQARR